MTTSMPTFRSRCRRRPSVLALHNNCRTHNRITHGLRRLVGLGPDGRYPHPIRHLYPGKAIYHLLFGTAR